MTKKIKSITLFKKDYINRQISTDQQDEKGYKYSFTSFDERGNLTLDVKYDTDGKTDEKYSYSFDDQGRLTEEISYLSETEIAEHKTYEYNPEGKLMRAFKHYADGSKDMIQYAYDEQGYLRSKITLDSDNEPESRETFEWENNNLVKKEVYEFEELTLREMNVFDDKGNRVENAVWTPEDGNTRTENFYNDKNELIKSLTYNNDDKLISKTIYSYDSKGKLVLADYESVRNKNTTTILYDEQGNATEQTEANEHGEINNQAIRKYNDRNEVIETMVVIDLHGKGLNQEYLLTYEYTYFNE
jgi:hypothetical protein